MKSSMSTGGSSSSNKWLLMGIGLLVVIAAVSWFFSRNQGGLREGTVMITAGGITLGSCTIADLERMPAVEKKVVLLPNCSGACGTADSDVPIEHVYTGVPLLEVLNSIDPGLSQQYKKVITRGIDYYSQVMEMSEIKKADEVYVVYNDYGKPLKTLNDKEGSLQLVVCSDASGQRFTRYLVSLELQ